MGTIRYKDTDLTSASRLPRSEHWIQSKRRSSILLSNIPPQCAAHLELDLKMFILHKLHLQQRKVSDAINSIYLDYFKTTAAFRRER